MSSFQHPNPSHGLKNTTDPAAQNEPKLEYSGTVIKDSLAAESIRSGGDFSKGNPTGISGTTAASSTLNRGDDTEGFRMVHASDGSSSGYGRKLDEDDGNNGEGYQPVKSGRSTGMVMQGNTEYDVGRATEERSQGIAKSIRPQKDGDFPAVNYVGRQPEIGSEEDPGRLAEQKFIERNARVANIVGSTGPKGDGDSKNPWDALDNERNL